MVTHDDHMAQRADCLVEIRDGRILADHPTSSHCSAPNHSDPGEGRKS